MPNEDNNREITSEQLNVEANPRNTFVNEIKKQYAFTQNNLKAIESKIN